MDSRCISQKIGAPKKIGRPRTPEQIEKLILKLAQDNGWGYTRILGELRKLGIQSVTETRSRKSSNVTDTKPAPIEDREPWMSV